MANENAIVNTTPTVSETPSNLVAEKENELSPNPAGFGFTKQLVVNSLPSPGVPNVLYLVPQYNGEGHVKEYYKYKWDVYKSAYERIFEPVNNVSYEKGEHATPVVENTAPTNAPEKIYNGPVVFNDDILYKGKKLPENDEVGSIVKANPTLAGTESALTGLDIDGTKYKVDQPINVEANPTLAGTEADLESLQVGNTKYKVPQGTPVEANPTLAGTESALEGLQVGNTKYKVGGSETGIHGYRFISTGGNYIVYYYTDNPNINSLEALLDDLHAKGYNSISNPYYINENTILDDGMPLVLNGMYYYTSDTVRLVGKKYNFTVNTSTGVVTITLTTWQAVLNNPVITKLF